MGNRIPKGVKALIVARKKLMEYYRADVELLDRTLNTDYGRRWGFTSE